MAQSFRGDCVQLFVRPGHWQLSKRVHCPDSCRAVHCPPALALPQVRDSSHGLRQHSRAELAFAWGPLPQLQGKNLRALSPCRAFYGSPFCRLLCNLRIDSRRFQMDGFLLPHRCADHHRSARASSSRRGDVPGFRSRSGAERRHASRRWRGTIALGTPFPFHPQAAGAFTHERRSGRGHEGMGLGDVKMMLMVGAFFGLTRTFLTILLGTLLGSLIGISVVLSLFLAGWKRGVAQRASRCGLGSVRALRYVLASHYQLPFGSFLGAAALLVVFFGSPVLEWYFSLTGGL